MLSKRLVFCFLCTLSTKNTSIQMKLKNILLLFICLYAWVYMFPSPLDEIPGLDVVFAPYKKGLEMLTLWFGHNILGMAGLEKIEMTGSGDTTFDYVLLPVKLILALLLTLGSMWWLLRDSRRFDTFLFWTRTSVRWYLGLYMMIYGVAKVVENGQFQAPDLYDLNLRFGEFSPMGLLWRFMGFSHTYAAFTGMAEVIAGVLLLFRRTALLGAMLTVGVMLHVFMLNMCYDVPVKLFSFHLVLLGFGLMWQNIARLWRFFVLNQSVAPISEPDRLNNKRWMVIARHSLRVLFVGAMVFSVLYFSFSQDASTKDETPMRGIYDVIQFDHKLIAQPGSDSLKWDRAIVANNRMLVYTEDNRRQSFKFKPDSTLANFTIKSSRDSTQTYTFAAVRDSNIVHFNGIWKGDTLRATFRRIDEKMLLTNRGFHWINEYPFNK